MSETPETKASAAEIEEVLTELEQYRERIVNDALTQAQKVKIPKKVVMEHLKTNPEIVKIDAVLEQLRAQQESQGEPSTV